MLPGWSRLRARSCRPGPAAVFGCGNSPHLVATPRARTVELAIAEPPPGGPCFGQVDLYGDPAPPWQKGEGAAPGASRSITWSAQRADQWYCPRTRSRPCFVCCGIANEPAKYAECKCLVYYDDSVGLGAEESRPSTVTMRYSCSSRPSMIEGRAATVWERSPPPS